MLYPIAGLVTFLFTVVLTVAGLGAAFILIPVFIGLGVEVHVAMATALLLNSVAMAIASADYIRHKLVIFKTAIPIALVAVILSPLGAYLSRFTPRETLLWLFTGFLIFAGTMMLFYKPRPRVMQGDARRPIVYGVGVGEIAGFSAGLSGLAGGTLSCRFWSGSKLIPRKRPPQWHLWLSSPRWLDFWATWVSVILRPRCWL